MKKMILFVYMLLGEVVVSAPFTDDFYAKMRPLGETVEAVKEKVVSLGETGQLEYDRSPQFLSECIVALAYYSTAEDFCYRMGALSEQEPAQCKQLLREKRIDLNQRGWFIELVHPIASDNIILVFYSDSSEFFLVRQGI